MDFIQKIKQTTKIIVKMNFIVIDIDKPENIEMLANLISKHIKVESVKVEPVDWIDEKTARLILGGGSKMITRKTLYNYRSSGSIKFKLIGERKYLYNRKSIEKFLSS